MKSFKIIFVICMMIFSCKSADTIEEEVIDYDALNETEIQEYITKNNLTPIKSNTGLYYIITKEGIGKSPTLSSNVDVYYKGYDVHGIVFDESALDGVNFNLNQLIPGFSEGVTYLKEGGEAIFIIPSKLAYDSKIFSHPLKNKVLIFEVKLISVN